MSFIAGIDVDDVVSPLGTTLFGICTNGAAEAAKVVDAGIDALIDGLTIRVFFKYGNTADNPTLNVNSQGAYAIRRYGTQAAGKTAATSWNAESVVSLTFMEGETSYWYMNDWLNTEPSIPLASSSTNGLMASTDKVKLDGIETGLVKITSFLLNGGLPSWSTDSTYEGYGYKKTVSVTGLTSSMFPIVSFNPDDDKLYQFAPVATTANSDTPGTGLLTVYAKKLPTTSVTINVAFLKQG